MLKAYDALSGRPQVHLLGSLFRATQGDLVHMLHDRQNQPLLCTAESDGCDCWTLFTSINEDDLKCLYIM